MSNDNTIPSVTGFVGGGTADYIAPANVMTGAGDFTAAALFRIRNDEGEGVVWGNEDNGSGGGFAVEQGAGWAIVMAEDGVLTARVRDNTGALIEASVQLGPVADPAQGAGMYISRWILAHLVKAESQLHLYVNGVVVATTAFPNPTGPSFGQARVGNDTSGGEVGNSLFIGGVAYLNQELDGEIVAEHFASCVMSRSMAPLLLSLGQSSAAGDFTNRWTAGDLVDPAFPVGTLGVDAGGNKALIEGPPGAQLWQPRAGTVVLTKEVEQPPGPGQQPIMFSVKNVPWYAASAGAGGGGGGGCGTLVEGEVVTDDAQVTLASYSPTVNNVGVVIAGKIIAYSEPREGGPAFKTWIFSILGKRDVGVASVEATSINTQNGPQESEALAWAIDADDDGAGAIRILVTGDALQDVTFRVCAEALETVLQP